MVTSHDSNKASLHIKPERHFYTSSPVTYGELELSIKLQMYRQADALNLKAVSKAGSLVARSLWGCRTVRKEGKVRYWTVLSASSVLKHLRLGQAMEFNIPQPPPILLPSYRPFTHSILPSSSRDIRINISHCCKHLHNVQTKSQTRIHSSFYLQCKDALLSLKRLYLYVNNWIIDFRCKTDVSGAETRFWIFKNFLISL